jgi:hypothetical protein
MKSLQIYGKLLFLMSGLFFINGLTAQLSGDFITIIGTTDSEKRIVLLDPEDGSLVSDNYFDLSGLELGTVKHVLRVEDELWISDQTKDRVHRLDMEGNYLGAVGESGGLDNVRGLRIINGEVWLANAGSQNNAPGNAIIRISLDGEIIGNFPVTGSPWAFLPFGDDKALISFSSSGGFTSQIAEFDFAGNFIGSFNQPGELNFIQQISQMQDGQFLASSFSTGGYPSGVHQYDENGAYVATIGGTSGGGARGNCQLGNGNIVWTNGQGIHIADVAAGTSSLIYAGQYHYAENNSFMPSVMTLPFAEYFETETFPPFGWMSYNPDGSDVEWTISNAQNHTPDGSFSAFHDVGPSDVMEDGWLVTPAVELPEFWEIHLSFWSYNDLPADYFKNSVLISTGDGNPLNGEFTEVWFAENVSAEWIETEIVLSAFAGETVYLAFRYEGDNAHNWYLDDVIVEGMPPVLDPPTNLQYVVSGYNVSLTWEAPESKELLGFNVYKNNVKINELLIDETTYLDEDVPPGTHFYGVTAVFHNGESEQEGPVSVLVEGEYSKIQGFVRDAVTNLSIPSATLVAANSDNGTISYSTPFGSHIVLLLAEGQYDLVCNAEGYEPFTLSNVTVFNGMVKTFTFYLVPENDVLLTGISTRNPSDVLFYPNPAGNFIEMKVDGKHEVQIFNQTGKLVINKKITSKTKIDISGIPAGIYFVKVTSDQGVLVEKLIIQ